MNINTLITTLDNTNLTRETVDLKGKGDTISYANYTGQTLTLTINETNYSSLIRICLIHTKQDTAKLYLTNHKPNNTHNIDITDIETISIGE